MQYAGYVETPIIDYNLDVIQKRGFSQEQAMDMMLNANPHKRLIDANEVLKPRSGFVLTDQEALMDKR